MVFAVLLCAFCAASETGILSLNRFRLKHLVKTEPYARRITKLLQ
ncbi:MAG TPA: CNNM domain-containing protein, partial [Gammaproteobacteria bacterium]|nr:CNNM domain-containing protein [Gammaproteobacteria bacterium]